MNSLYCLLDCYKLVIPTINTVKMDGSNCVHFTRKNPFVIFWFSGIADSTLINNTNETLIEPVRKCSLLLEIEAAFMKEKLLEEQKRKCKSLK